jgi:hypothetical protein
MDGSMHRLTVAEAAAQLGITSDAVRQRVRRGSIQHERDKDGKVYVYIHPDDTHPDARQDAYRDELMQELRNRIEFQERELERKDAIIMQMAQSIGQLEAPPGVAPEARESSVAASEGRGNGTPPVEEESTYKPSWWRRFFGLEAN